MAVTKRTRYEVLRRDNHTCRYCGGKAPDVELTVDHVVPVALGGGDEPENLVAACRDCNAGKSSTQPDQALVSDVQEDALRWARARRAATEQAMLVRGQRDAYIHAFLEVWEEFDASLNYLPADFDGILTYWHASGVPVELVTDAVFIAWSKRHIAARATFRYAIGIVKNQIADIDVRARALLDVEEAPDGA